MAKRRQAESLERLTIGHVYVEQAVEIRGCEGEDWDVLLGGEFWSDHDTRAEAIAEADMLVRRQKIDLEEEP